jgi:hypothetical protein
MNRTVPFAIAAVSVIALAITPFENADAQRRIVPYVGGGLSIGTGDLSTDSDNGWLVYGGIDLPLTSGWTLGGTLSYAHIPYRGGFSEATNATSLLMEVGYLFFATSPGGVKPYVRAGGGMFRQKYDPGNTGYTSTSQSTLAASVGAGLNLAFGATAAFAGVHFVGTSDSGFLAVHGGLAFPGSSKR